MFSIFYSFEVKSIFFVCFLLTGCTTFNPPPIAPETPLTPKLSLPPVALILVLPPQIIQTKLQTKLTRQVKTTLTTNFPKKLSLALSETGNPALPFSPKNQIPLYLKTGTVLLKTILFPKNELLYPLFYLSKKAPGYPFFLPIKQTSVFLHGNPFPDYFYLPFSAFRKNAKAIANYLQNLRPTARIFTFCNQPKLFIAEAKGLSAQDNLILTTTIRHFLYFNGVIPVLLKAHPPFLLVPRILLKNITKQFFSSQKKISLTRLTLIWQLFRLEKSSRHFLVALTQTHILTSAEVRLHWPQISFIAVQNIIPFLKNQLQSACRSLHRQQSKFLVKLKARL